MALHSEAGQLTCSVMPSIVTCPPRLTLPPSGRFGRLQAARCCWCLERSTCRPACNDRRPGLQQARHIGHLEGDMCCGASSPAPAGKLHCGANWLPAGSEPLVVRLQASRVALETGAVGPLNLERAQCNLPRLMMVESQGAPVPRPGSAQPLQQQISTAVHKALLIVCFFAGRSNTLGRQVTCPQRGHCSLMRHSASSLSSSGIWPSCSSAVPCRREDLQLLSAGCKDFGFCFLGAGDLHCRYGACKRLDAGKCTPREAAKRAQLMLSICALQIAGSPLAQGKHLTRERFSLCYSLGRAVQG